jgi:adenylate kinase family enzyme
VKRGIILLGANGAGKSAVGRELARLLGFAHLNDERYYFYETYVPYTVTRPLEERVRMLLADMDESGSYVMSGDVSGWGDVFLTRFSLAVFLLVPTDVRVARVVSREERWGDRTREGGDMYESQAGFLEYAASRDIELLKRRAARYACPLVYMDGTEHYSSLILKISDYFQQI